MEYNTDFEVRKAILAKLGGDMSKLYNTIFEVDLAILEATQGGGSGEGGIKVVTDLSEITNPTNLMNAYVVGSDGNIKGFWRYVESAQRWFPITIYIENMSDEEFSEAMTAAMYAEKTPGLEAYAISSIVGTFDTATYGAFTLELQKSLVYGDGLFWFETNLHAANDVYRQVRLVVNHQSDGSWRKSKVVQNVESGIKTVYSLSSVALPTNLMLVYLASGDGKIKGLWRYVASERKWFPVKMFIENMAQSEINDMCNAIIAASNKPETYPYQACSVVAKLNIVYDYIETELNLSVVHNKNTIWFETIFYNAANEPNRYTAMFSLDGTDWHYQITKSNNIFSDYLNTNSYVKQVTLTQEEYDALGTKDTNTLYIISDAQ